MSRYPGAHKDVVRRRLIAGAAELVRERGLPQLSVARVMGRLKMTVGGFYRHFDSQRTLASEAMAAALRDARRRLFAGLDDLRGVEFERALIERYLSRAHLADVTHGCPVAANVSELSRVPLLATGPFADEVKDLVAYAAARVRAIRGPSAPRSAEPREPPIRGPSAPRSAEPREPPIRGPSAPRSAEPREPPPIRGPSAPRSAEPREPPPDAETRAWLLVSTCVGALAIARALGRRRGDVVLGRMRAALIASLG